MVDPILLFQGAGFLSPHQALRQFLKYTVSAENVTGFPAHGLAKSGNLNANYAKLAKEREVCLVRVHSRPFVAFALNHATKSKRLFLKEFLTTDESTAKRTLYREVAKVAKKKLKSRRFS
jgi:hypothetical protein